MTEPFGFEKLIVCRKAIRLVMVGGAWVEALTPLVAHLLALLSVTHPQRLHVVGRGVE